MRQISIRRKATNIEIPAALPAVSTKIGGNVRFRLTSVNRRTGPTADNQHVATASNVMRVMVLPITLTTSVNLIA
jgi:hypothetical protein